MIYDLAFLRPLRTASPVARIRGWVIDFVRHPANMADHLGVAAKRHSLFRAKRLSLSSQLHFIASAIFRALPVHVNRPADTELFHFRLSSLPRVLPAPLAVRFNPP